MRIFRDIIIPNHISGLINSYITLNMFYSSLPKIVRDLQTIHILQSYSRPPIGSLLPYVWLLCTLVSLKVQVSFFRCIILCHFVLIKPIH